jgi:ATP-binding cassette subfamily C (CFTR/MRP) protein 4
MRMGFQARSGLIALLYRKSLTLSTSTSIGKIINLISNDVQCFENASALGHYIWLSIVDVIGSTIFLYIQLGWASLIGIAVVALLIPMHSRFAKRFSRLRTETVQNRDERIRSLSDLLTGIELIKLSAWEDPLEARVNQQRDKELSTLFKAAMIKAFNMGLHFALPCKLKMMCINDDLCRYRYHFYVCFFNFLCARK